jgi:hypothetical protein
METKKTNLKTPGKETGKGKRTFDSLGIGNQVKQVRYEKLREDEDDANLGDPTSDSFWRSQVPFTSSQGAAQQEGIRKHEIYDQTYYIPNSKIRILETPISASLTFQMLLYYHFFYNMLYTVVIFTTIIYKLWVLQPNIINILALIVGLIVWFPVELARLNYGYKGNINETVSII